MSDRGRQQAAAPRVLDGHAIDLAALWAQGFLGVEAADAGGRDGRLAEGADDVHGEMHGGDGGAGGATGMSKTGHHGSLTEDAVEVVS